MDDNPATNLIKFLNRGGQQGYYWLKFPAMDGEESGPKRTIWFEAGKPATWPEGSYDLYFGVHPSKYIPQRKSKKTSRFISPHLLRTTLPDIAAVNCLFAEFDAKHYKGGKDEALEYIHHLSIDPNVLIDSGGGYHAYWLLIQPIPISDEFTLNRMRSIQYRWVEFVDGDTESKDLCRVLRVPGSYNYKYDPPREVKILYADYDLAYELHELTRVLPPVQEPKPKPSIPNQSYTGQRDPCTHWLDAALKRLIPGDAQRGRNGTGYWLAQQLVWDGVGDADQERVMLAYVAEVRTKGDHDYTEEEALKSLNSARNSRKQGEPARRMGGAVTQPAPVRLAPSQKTNGNGNGKPVIVTYQAIPLAAQSQSAGSNGKNGDTAPVQEPPEEPPSPNNDDTDQKILLSASQDHDGHAHCVLALYPNRFLYCDKWGWLYYDGKAWKMEGAEGAINRAIIETLKARRIAAVKAEMESLVKVTRANSSNVNGVRDILKNYVETFTEDFDNDPDLLNCFNGSLNLRTGQLTHHNPKQHFTYCIPIDYDPKASYDDWINYLTQAVDHQEVAKYIQIAVGYSLTGHTYEEVMFYLYGPPRSGKGTFTETLLSLLGNQPLATEVDFTTFTSNRSGDTQNFDLAPLKPCRFIVASESNKNQPLNPAKIKALTGRNYVYCAFKHRDHFGYQPMFKIWLSSNYPVNVDVEDDAAWGRVRVIEFPHSHLGEEDKTLKVKMLTPESLRGILRWAVEGAQKWYELWNTSQGLPLPDVIREAAEKQRDQQDHIKAFVEECCLQCKPDDKDPWTIGSEVYQSYKTWCEANGVTPKYRNKFTEAMGRRGYPSKPIKHPITNKTVRVIQGIKLLA